MLVDTIHRLQDQIQMLTQHVIKIIDNQSSPPPANSTLQSVSSTPLLDITDQLSTQNNAPGVANDIQSQTPTAQYVANQITQQVTQQPDYADVLRTTAQPQTILATTNEQRVGSPVEMIKPC